VREGNGLALSSRNGYLNDIQRASASQLNKALQGIVENIKAGHSNFEQLESRLLLDANPLLPSPDVPKAIPDQQTIVSTLPPSVKWRFVAKKELVRVPVFGQALLASGHIIIDRGNRERAVASLRRAAERIRAGTSVIVFPEGTRSPDGHLRLFKSGPFHLAVEAQVPIIPVTVSGSQHITPKGELRVHPGRVKIAYGKPIPTRGVSIAERKLLAARVRDAIARGYDVAYQGSVVLEPTPSADEPALA
jgi:1-acyl-sn-glycerol-3-phosphate acyltransferase